MRSRGHSASLSRKRTREGALNFQIEWVPRSENKAVVVNQINGGFRVTKRHLADLLEEVRNAPM